MEGCSRDGRGDKVASVFKIFRNFRRCQLCCRLVGRASHGAFNKADVVRARAQSCVFFRLLLFEPFAAFPVSRMVFGKAYGLWVWIGVRAGEVLSV